MILCNRLLSPFFYFVIRTKMSHGSDLRRRGQQQQQDEGGNEKREERQPLEWKQGGDGGGGGGGGNGNGGDGGEGASPKNDDTEETKKVQCVCVYHRSLLCNVRGQTEIFVGYI